jgi:hypothetical protein
MVVAGDYIAIRRGTVHERYHIPEKTKEGFRRFDRGEEVVSDYCFEAPNQRR